MKYIYIYRERERERERATEREGVGFKLHQVILGITLSNVTLPNNLLLNSYFKIPQLNYMFYIYLTCMLIFMSIRCYLPCNL